MTEIVASFSDYELMRQGTPLPQIGQIVTVGDRSILVTGVARNEMDRSVSVEGLVVSDTQAPKESANVAPELETREQRPKNRTAAPVGPRKLCLD